MTPRERHTPDAGGAALPLPRPGGPAPDVGPPAAEPLWDALLRHALPQQRQHLLDLARREGLLDTGRPGPAPADRPAGDPDALAALLQGRVRELPPAPAAELTFFDPHLDAAQRAAVARAVATPDVCLIAGLPGTGKSRVLVEALAQLVGRGERVLLLSPTAAGLDRVLEPLARREGVCAVRCLAPDETPESLPAPVRRLTVAERLRALTGATLTPARQAAGEARRGADRLRAQAADWAAFRERLAARAEVESRRARLAAGRDAVDAEVAADPALAAELAPAREQADKEAGVLRAQADALGVDRAKARQALDEAARARDALAALQAASGGFRFWSGAWWQARGEQDLPERLAQARGKHAAAAKIVQDLDGEYAALEGRLGQVEQAFRDREAERRAALRRARLDVLDREEADLAGPAAALDAEAARLRGRLGLDAAADAEAAFARWREDAAAGEAEADRATRWVRDLDNAMAALPARLAACAHVVAAPPGALDAEASRGDAAPTAGVFDVLVLEEAEHLTESEFARLARRGRRWILVGRPAPDPEPPAAPARGPAALAPGLFHRLWRALHPDLRRLPYRWARPDGALRCRLRPVPAGQQRWLGSEPVADRPDITLNILRVPRAAPQLAEVVFPRPVTHAQAKAYIAAELGEVALETRGGECCWVEEGERVVLRLDAVPERGVQPLAVADGVSEWLAADDATAAGDGHTVALAFDRSAGWTRERAAGWLADTLGVHDPGRTALLTAPHRMRRGLAAAVQALVGEDGRPGWAVTSVPAGEGAEAPAFEFVAVPHLSEAGDDRRGGEGDGRWHGGGTATMAPRARTARGGAGLEADLAEPRRADVLPPECRAALPRQGLVNYPEATAVVQALERLADDPALAVAARSWPCPSGEPNGPPAHQANGHACAARAVHGPVVGVLALYPAQVTLLKHLIGRSARLAAAPVSVEVGLPADFAHRECLVALISLTRSHGHRAVTYGGHPQELVEALTRASARLLVFGDPGTLHRRAGWAGPLDHLDEASAARERALAHQLVRAHDDGA